MATTEQSSPAVVCDAGPLIHLDELDTLDLLSDFSEILVPEAVWREVERHRPQALLCAGVQFRRVLPQQPVPPELEVLAQALSLHVGEWEALRVAIEHSPVTLLTDDTAARLAAGNLRISTHGTIGVLVRAIRRHQRTKEQTIALLRSLPEKTTLHLKRSLLESVIREVEKSA